jgi:amino acid adenylation domain-containing protein
MGDRSKPQQHSVAAHCVRPLNAFIQFEAAEIEQAIPDRFEQQAKRYPNRIAVKTRDHELTYEALNEAANRVAHAILARCGEGEEPIALLFEHGAPAIVATLAVLKTGKIYVPLDPSYPRARMAYMLEDSRACLIVTHNKNLPLAVELAQNALQVIRMDALDSHLSEENLGLSISPDAPAYILYTSGSTGQPKGVVQNHRNVLHEIMNYTNAAHMGADDRMLLISSLSFADAVRTLYGALLNGAALLPLDLKQEGLGSLARWLMEEEITIYRSVPTTFRHFCRSLTGGRKFPQLRLVYLAGEPVYRGDVEVYKKHFSADCILVNGLGSSETLTYRWYFLHQKTPIAGHHVPVGYAVEGKETLLLDESGQEVALGRIGEIAVKSRYLSPGYWRRPDLTQDKFLPDPRGTEERIYLTGDLGRLMPDDCLVHVGRKDFQLKVRGFRIEPAEIEMALLDHAAIQEAVVVTRSGSSGDPRLVAYLVPGTRTVPAIGELQRFLADRLPDYMIPATFVMLDALPLTPNGKVDRRALPVPDSERLEGAFVAPHSPMEKLVAGIWQDLLGVDRVSVHDNFFDLGGDSLLALQAIAPLEHQLDLRIHPRELTVQTLGQFAAACEERAHRHPRLPFKGWPHKLLETVKRVIFRRAADPQNRAR